MWMGFEEGDTGQWTVPRTPPHPHHSSHVRSLLYSLPPLCMVPFAAPWGVHNIYHMKCAHSPRYWLSTFTYLKHLQILLSQPLSQWQQSQFIQSSQTPRKAQDLGTLASPAQFVYPVPICPLKGLPRVNTLVTFGLTHKRMRSWGGGGFHGFDGTLGNVTSWLQFSWEPWRGSGSLGHRACLSFLIKHISLLCGPQGRGVGPYMPSDWIVGRAGMRRPLEWKFWHIPAANKGPRGTLAPLFTATNLLSGTLAKYRIT